MLRRRGMWQGSLLGSVCDLKPIEIEHHGVNLTKSFRRISTAIFNQFYLFFLLVLPVFPLFHPYTFLHFFLWFLGCNCSGLADECVFDAEQYRSTGSGGRCVGCRENTAGPHCERCRENFFRSLPQRTCQNCNCNAVGELYTHIQQSNRASVTLFHTFTTIFYPPM